MQISWTHALRQIVINCYKYHGREDLLPAFSEDDEKANVAAVVNAGTTGSGATGTSGNGGSGSNGGSGGSNNGGATVGTVLKLHSHKLQTATQSHGASAGGGGGAGGSIATTQLATASPITATTAQVCRLMMQHCCLFYFFIYFFLLCKSVAILNGGENTAVLFMYRLDVGVNFFVIEIFVYDLPIFLNWTSRMCLSSPSISLRLYCKEIK